MDKKFYFFDLDGTLADTDCDIRLAWKATLKSLGLESPDFDEKYVTGPPIREILQLLFPTKYTPELEEAARTAFGRFYDNCGFPNTPEYPGVMDRVKALKAAGARVFIVTNKRWLGAKAIAEKYRWLDVFEGLYTGDMYMERGLGGLGSLGGLRCGKEVESGICKPLELRNSETQKPRNLETPKYPNTVLRKPELLARIMAEHGAKPEECVMVGDTCNDFEAAQKNGITSIAVSWGYGTPDELAMADRIVRTPEEI